MKATLASTALALALSACGTAPEAALSELRAGPPDLRFSGIPVTIYLPSGGTVDVLNGATFQIPCNTTGFRAKYRYENAGQSGAATHNNQSGVIGGATYNFAQNALPMSTLRYAWASFGGVPANVEQKIWMRLDSGPAVVGESNELNNAWVAKVVRTCP